MTRPAPKPPASPERPVLPSVTVRPISADEHLAWIRSRRSSSFLQTPAWARVKRDWDAESLGWFEGDRLVAAALVLYRQVPKVKRYLAYLPEGPALDWSAPRIVDYLRELRDYLKGKRVFAIRMGPPVVLHRWGTITVKDAIADEAVDSLTQVPPDVTEELGTSVHDLLTRLGFRHRDARGGFTEGQPQFLFQLPLTGPTPTGPTDNEPLTEADLLAGMNQLWRRNIKKSAKAGVEVVRGTPADLPAFHRVYVETAGRDGFTPRPLAYFENMVAAMTAEDPERIHLYLARHDGELVAATLWVRVGRHAWYAYGASTSAKRDVQGSTAIQWQMIRDALAAGAEVYDMRGITDAVSADDPHLGLLRFKVGTGGEAVELVGEWDLPLNKALYAAFDFYLRRR